RVSGTLRSEVAHPGGPGEAAGILAAAAAGGAAVAFAGGGTKSGWGAPLRPVELVCSSAAMDGILSHAKEDLTVAVGAGIALDDLQAALAGAGQWLAIDPPGRPGATLGGIVATGDAGPRRLRYGGIRDLVIGMTLVLADGTVAHSGGKVIKNVAGYDLCKLACGSLGTLAMVAEVVLRLHPLPRSTATLRLPAALPLAAAAARLVMDSQVEASALDWTGDELLVRLEGTGGSLTRRVDACARILSAEGHGGGGPDLLQDDEEAAAWSAAAGRHAAAPQQTLARAATLPDRLEAVAEALRQAAVGREVEAQMSSYLGSGLHDAVLSGPAGEVCQTLQRWRERVGQLGGTVVVRDRPPEVTDRVDAWGPPPPAHAVMRRLKADLDPDGRLCPGRFEPWW
ncbi:MAG: FAD-binding oxidoreductase, partial [Acidimicrobiales bacterium]